MDIRYSFSHCFVKKQMKERPYLNNKQENILLTTITGIIVSFGFILIVVVNFMCMFFGGWLTEMIYSTNTSNNFIGRVTIISLCILTFALPTFKKN